MIQNLLIVIAAGLLDLLLGDPCHWPHPVKGIGWLIVRIENLLRRMFPSGKFGERIAGSVMVCLMLGIVQLGVFFGIRIFNSIHQYFTIAMQVWFSYQLLAMKSLKDESMKVCKALEHQSIGAARKAVARIVGRDTAQLSAEGVTKAAIETVAENTSDGVIAPLLYMICFGVMGGFFYKTVNTMDSMIGYQNDRYRYFGTAAARLDDLCNFIPARFGAFCMLIAAWVLKMDSRQALAVYRRDRKNHKSPNSAHTEAVCAGALGIQLAGDACYFGQYCPKPVIGNNGRPVVSEDIRRANRLLYMTAAVAILLASMLVLLGICLQSFDLL